LKTKGISWLLSIALIFSIVFAGCKQQGSQTDNQAAEEANDTATHMNLWTFVELHNQFWENAAQTWNNSEPDRRIELQCDFYPYDIMHNKLQIALQSGAGAPDLVDIELTRYPAFLKGDISLVPLNNIILPIKDQLIMSRFENYAHDGNYYGVDYHLGATVAFYNKEIMKEAGVDINEIKLWSDYIEAGKKVVEKTGKPMTTIEVTNMWSYYPLISQQGSDYLNKDGSIQLDNDINIKTLQFLKDLIYKEKIAIIAPGGEHDQEDYFNFMNNGGAASVIMPVWFMGRFTDYMPNLKGKMTARPMPAWEPGGFRSAGMGGTGTSITNQCVDIKLAMEFLAKSKLTEEAAVKAWVILGFDPVYKVAYGNPALFAGNKYTDYFGIGLFPTIKSIIDETNSLNVGELFPDAATGVARSVLFKVLSDQSRTPEEALKELADELRQKAR